MLLFTTLLITLWAAQYLVPWAVCSPCGTLRREGQSAKIRALSLCFHAVFGEFRKNFTGLSKNRLRVLVGIRKSPLTGGAEALGGTPDGAAARRQAEPAQT
ncbi:hypothetical protein, partial [Salipiger sp. PrR002]|uniref:hypothetical protein n=1 Tax=Salipiger sp. PrR002 TaxID=2706489 RepID=UPI0019424010